MNLELYSKHMGAVCLSDVRELKTFDINLIPYNEIKEILEIAQNIRLDKDTKEINRGVLIGHVHQGLHRTVDILYDYMHNDLANKKLDKVKEETIGIKQQLKDYHKRTLFANQLDHVANLVRSGKIDEANKELFGLRYDEPKFVEPSVMYMLDSIGKNRTFKTGINAIDTKLGGLRIANLMGLIGDSGQQKTMVSVWLVLNILMTNPTFECLYFEKEMAVSDIAQRFVANLCGIPLTELATIQDHERQKYGDTIFEKLHEDKYLGLLSRLHIIPNTAFEDATDMVSYVESYKANLRPDGHIIWVLDYLTMLGDNEVDKNKAIENESTIMKELTLNTESFGIVLMQLKANTVEERKNKIPVASDTEYGKKLKQYAGYLWSCFNPSYYYDESYAPKGYYYLISVKNRFGNPINIQLKSRAHICDYEEPDPFEDKQMRDWLANYRINPGK